MSFPRGFPPEPFAKNGNIPLKIAQNIVYKAPTPPDTLGRVFDIARPVLGVGTHYFRTTLWRKGTRARPGRRTGSRPPRLSLAGVSGRIDPRVSPRDAGCSKECYSDRIDIYRLLIRHLRRCNRAAEPRSFYSGSKIKMNSKSGSA